MPNTRQGAQHIRITIGVVPVPEPTPIPVGGVPGYEILGISVNGRSAKNRMRVAAPVIQDVLTPGLRRSPGGVAWVRGLMHQVVEMWPSGSSGAAPISGSGGSGGASVTRRDSSRAVAYKDKSRTVIMPARRPFKINV